MRLVVQRVKDCRVIVKKELISQIEYGLLAYLGIEKRDSFIDLDYLARKLLNLRIFADSEGKMNLSIQDLNYKIMLISQFTICADTQKGNRPSYNNAEDPKKAKCLYHEFIMKLRESPVEIKAGLFQEEMEVIYTNDGPVTILLDSRKVF
jgi:D-aminoacyl-tRNA deacylase